LLLHRLADQRGERIAALVSLGGLQFDEATDLVQRFTDGGQKIGIPE
jgi:hypothetical protein